MGLPFGLDPDAIAKPYVEKMGEMVSRLDRVIELLEEIAANTKN